MRHGTTEEISFALEQHQDMYLLAHIQILISSGSATQFVSSLYNQNEYLAGRKTLHKSSVVCVRLDPLSSRVVASASTDGSCYITTCYLKDIDNNNSSGPFANVTSYGETLISLKSIGWVNTVSFSPDTSLLCYASK